jgi:hypothetical protein
MQTTDEIEKYTIEEGMGDIERVCWIIKYNTYNVETEQQVRKKCSVLGTAFKLLNLINTRIH